MLFGVIMMTIERLNECFLMTEKQADLQLAGRCTFEAVKNLADLSTKRGFK